MDKVVVEIATNYIFIIYMYIISSIESKKPVNYLKLCKKKFVVLILTVWSDKAKNITIKVDGLLKVVSVPK